LTAKTVNKPHQQSASLQNYLVGKISVSSNSSVVFRALWTAVTLLYGDWPILYYIILYYITLHYTLYLIIYYI